MKIKDNATEQMRAEKKRFEKRKPKPVLAERIKAREKSRENGEKIFTEDL